MPKNNTPKGTENEEPKIYGSVKGPYTQSSIKKRIEALFLDNLGKILTREQIVEVAKDPRTGKEPENWHQRLSELRTDDGYTILTWRNRGYLRIEEYLMPHSKKCDNSGKRVRPADTTWLAILKRAHYACEWNEDGTICGLKDGEIDPVGGGRTNLTPDHQNPHSINSKTDIYDPEQWRALCGRHQVMKKNYWDSTTGKLNVYSIIQAANRTEKSIVFKFLLDYYGYKIDTDGAIVKNKQK